MNRGRALGPGALRKRGKVWVLDWTSADGRRRRKVLGGDRRTAERIRAELIRARDLELAGMGAEGGQEMPLGDLLELYLADLRPRVTSMHFKNVEQRLRHVVECLGEKRVGDLRPMDAVRVRSEATAGGASNRTANLLIDRLRAMLRWAEENELIGASPIRRLKRLPETRDHQKYRRRALTEDEIARLLAASEADDAECAVRWEVGQVYGGGAKARPGSVRVPQTPFWTALLETGARYGELRQATWGDVDFDRGELVLRSENTKSRKQRAIPLRPETVEALRRLRALHQRVYGRLATVADPIFLSPDGRPWGRYTTNAMRILDRVLGRAGIPKINARGEKLDVHALRHSAATRLLRGGAGLAKAQRLLGHSDPKLTAAVYGHLDAEDLREAVESLPPLCPAPANTAAS